MYPRSRDTQIAKVFEDLAKQGNFSRNRARIRAGSLFSIMGWRIVYIEESDKLLLYLDNLKIFRNDEEFLLSLKDIDVLVLDNYKLTLSLQLINALTSYNINTIICGMDHLPTTHLQPYSGNYYSSEIFYRQLNWTSLQKEIATQAIIKSKIWNQQLLLKHHKASTDGIELLEKYHNEVELNDKSNREGLSAKKYFSCLFGQGFKRFNDDVINAGLNYGYSILRSQISKSLVAKGLNPKLGLFHKGNSNLFNLSDDIIEPFRPIVDHYVKNNLEKEKLFLREHRLGLIKLLTENLRYKNQRQTTSNVIDFFIDEVINFMDNNCQGTLVVPIINFDDL